MVQYLSRNLKPKTNAYHDICVKGEHAVTAEDDEPFYGAQESHLDAR
jgi:hypothetical protein